MARLLSHEANPHPGPQHRGGLSQGAQPKQRGAMPLARPGGNRPVLLGLLLGTQEPPEVSQLSQGSPEDLTATEAVTGASFRDVHRVTKGWRDKLRKDRRQPPVGQQQLAAAPQKDPNTKGQLSSLQGWHLPKKGPTRP